MKECNLYKARYKKDRPYARLCPSQGNKTLIIPGCEYYIYITKSVSLFSENYFTVDIYDLDGKYLGNFLYKNQINPNVDWYPTSKALPHH